MLSQKTVKSEVIINGIATKILFTGAVFVTAGTVLAAAALTDPKCRDKLKECAEKLRNGKKDT